MKTVFRYIPVILLLCFLLWLFVEYKEFYNSAKDASPYNELCCNCFVPKSAMEEIRYRYYRSKMHIGGKNVTLYFCEDCALKQGKRKIGKEIPRYDLPDKPIPPTFKSFLLLCALASIVILIITGVVKKILVL